MYRNIYKLTTITIQSHFTKTIPTDVSIFGAYIVSTF